MVGEILDVPYRKAKQGVEKMCGNSKETVLELMPYW
jgi:hypothetical protein